MDNIEDVNSWIKILECYKNILKVSDNEKEYIIDRIQFYEAKVDNYNKQYLTIVNPTKKEVALVYNSLKKKIIFMYVNTFLDKNVKKSKTYKIDLWSCRLEIENEIHDSVYNMNLPLDLVYKKILLKRKYGEYYKYDKIGLEINEFIQLKLVEFWSKKKMYLLAVTIIALATVIAWMVVETISVKREMKQLTDDYLKPKNDSFINPNVETYNEIVEDLSKEERYLNWLNDAKKEKR